MNSQLAMEHLEASGSPRESGGSATSSRSHACLDQFSPMLPFNPVQQLPLLPIMACTTSTVRVAAWLLEQGWGEQALGADFVGAGHSGESAASSCGEAVQGDDEDVEELMAFEAADQQAQQQAQLAQQQEHQQAELRSAAHNAAAAGSYRTPGVLCEGRRGCVSPDLFLSTPVQHGHAPNNYGFSLH